jgi:predicted nucleic acid-binding protein
VIVVDTSAIVDLLLEIPPNHALVNRLAGVSELHAPHLIDVEFLSVLRRLVGRKLLSSAQADIARKKIGQLPLYRYPHVVLADRVWALRDNITAYDACYVALAETLDLPLITSDNHLAGTSGHHARIESFAR